MSLYQRITSFFDWSTQNPDKPHAGVDLDREFDNVGSKLNRLATYLDKIQRADGRLRNGTVYLETCSQELIDFITAYGGSGVFVPGDGDTDGSTGDGGSTTSATGTILFRGLVDTPNSFAGSGGYQVVVAETEDRLVFRQIQDPEIRLQDATDIPTLEGQGGRVLAVAEGEEGFEFQLLNIEPGALYSRLDAGNDFQGNSQKNMVLSAYAEDVLDLGNISGNVAIDPSSSNVFTAVVDGALTLNWLVGAEDSKAYSCTIRLEIVGTQDITWFAGTNWGYETVEEDDGNGGVITIERARSAPKIYPDGAHVFTFIRFPDGTTHGFVQ